MKRVIKTVRFALRLKKVKSENDAMRKIAKMCEISLQWNLHFLPSSGTKLHLLQMTKYQKVITCRSNT